MNSGMQGKRGWIAPFFTTKSVANEPPKDSASSKLPMKVVRLRNAYQRRLEHTHKNTVYTIEDWRIEEARGSQRPPWNHPQ